MCFLAKQIGHVTNKILTVGSSHKEIWNIWFTYDILYLGPVWISFCCGPSTSFDKAAPDAMDWLALHLTTLADNCVDLASAASSSALGHSHGSATTLLLWPRMSCACSFADLRMCLQASVQSCWEHACCIWLSLKNMCGPITLVRQKMKKVRRKILTCSSIMSVRQKRRKRFYQRTNGVPQCSKVF